jgi:hypothetical protein
MTDLVEGVLFRRHLVELNDTADFRESVATGISDKRIGYVITGAHTLERALADAKDYGGLSTRYPPVGLFLWLPDGTLADECLNGVQTLHHVMVCLAFNGDNFHMFLLFYSFTDAKVGGKNDFGSQLPRDSREIFADDVASVAFSGDKSRHGMVFLSAMGVKCVLSRKKRK